MNRNFGVNQAIVEELFLRYCDNPTSVPEQWRRHFESLPVEELPQLTSAGMISAAGAEVPAVQAARGAPPAPELPQTQSPRLPPSVLLPPTAEIIPFVERRLGDREGPESRKPSGTSFPPSSDLLAATELQGRVSALVNAYRVRGHLYANLDPLGLLPRRNEDLLLERYGLNEVDPETSFSTGDLAGPRTLPLIEIVARLRETYCRTIGVEFTFIEDTDERRWLQHRMESSCNRVDLTEHEQRRILTKLTDAEIFEQFLHTNYVGAKRFSLEGAESFIPMVDLLVERSADLGVEEVVIGMAHRGRLNVLANILEKRLHEIFADFEDVNPEAHIGRGDVKYHLGYSKDRVTETGRRVHLTLTFNPSHLEFVAPVVEGRVRAKQDRRGDEDHHRVLPLLVHGDAAFAGQGIVSETLNLSDLEGYRTGGTVHVVINNQVGFTTLPEDSRSTRYCTDITRMLRCPVFHVNGEDPEAVAQVVRLATEYRQTFHRNVIIDLYCYRKYGHNEGDEPRFTQPVMYSAVDKKETVREVYVERLVSLGKLTNAQAEEIKARRRIELEAALQETRNGDFRSQVVTMQGAWKRYVGGPDSDVPDVDTRVPLDQLAHLVRLVNKIPQGFSANTKISRRLYDHRLKQGLGGKAFDWGTAETLAYASLVAEGTPVRISGQDSRRGTFSHRHAFIYDTKTGKAHSPMQHISEDQGAFEIYDSPLSEAGVLGFDYGYSLDSPHALVVWEAQFGDFVNAAQVIIDQFIASSEDKWHRLTGLVMLLPHGFEGQGPEHSSARLGRFLGQCAEDNMQICNLTTPAQIFHCLRRQVVRPWRKPLVIMTPKSLLRHPRARSTLSDLAEGSFQRIIPDHEVAPEGARRVLLCSGKIYYDLLAEREERTVNDVAIVRMEQLYPIRPEELEETLAPYPDGTDLVWIQEEPWNMGAWFYMLARMPSMLGKRFGLRCISRPESASPATGSKAAHVMEQQSLLSEAFAE